MVNATMTPTCTDVTKFMNTIHVDVAGEDNITLPLSHKYRHAVSRVRAYEQLSNVYVVNNVFDGYHMLSTRSRHPEQKSL